jgi:hypothetical protein
MRSFFIKMGALLGVVAAAGCLHDSASVAIPKGFPAQLVPSSSETLACGVRRASSECWFLVPRAARAVFGNAKRAALRNGFHAFREASADGTHVFIGRRGRTGLTIAVAPPGAAIESQVRRVASNAPRRVPAHHSLLNVSEGRWSSDD